MLTINRIRCVTFTEPRNLPSYDEVAYVLVDSLRNLRWDPISEPLYRALTSEEGYGAHLPTGFQWIRLEPSWKPDRNPLTRWLASMDLSTSGNHPVEAFKWRLEQEVLAAIHYRRAMRGETDPVTGDLINIAEALKPIGGHTPARWAWMAADTFLADERAVLKSKKG